MGQSRQALGHRDQQHGVQAARISGRGDSRNSELSAEKHTGESGDMCERGKKEVVMNCS